MTPKLTSLVYTFSFGGKRPLWHARHPTYPNIIGAGGSAARAGKDWQNTYNLLRKRNGVEVLPTSVHMVLEAKDNRIGVSYRAGEPKDPKAPTRTSDMAAHALPLEFGSPS